MRYESENSATTKVVIGGTLPALLRDIVSRVVESSAHISVISPESEEPAGLTEYVRLHDVDVVIVGCEPALMDLGDLSPQTLLGVIRAHHSSSAEPFTRH